MAERADVLETDQSESDWLSAVSHRAVKVYRLGWEEAESRQAFVLGQCLDV